MVPMLEEYLLKVVAPQTQRQLSSLVTHYTPPVRRQEMLTTSSFFLLLLMGIILWKRQLRCAVLDQTTLFPSQLMLKVE